MPAQKGPDQTMETPSTRLREVLEALLSSSQVATGERLAARSPGYCPEAYGAGLLALSETVQDVSKICKWANAQGVKLVPHSGLTGLVDATASEPGEVAVPLERLNRIIEIDAAQGVAVVEAGVTLQSLIDACEPMGLMPAIDIPSRESWTVGMA